MKKYIALAALLASTWSAQAQWELFGNSSLTQGVDFLGTTDGSFLDVRTEDIRRMTLLPDATYTIGSFTTQVKDGSLLLCPDVDGFYGGGAPGPYTGLHLAAATNNTQESGYRSNMGNGITMTGNNDQMYVGQLFNGLDYTDAAIVWSDNPGEWLADRLTFNFTSSYNGSEPSGNNSFRGLQTMLVQPAESGQEAFVGVGDFDAVSATPEERLDVLDGKVRIRELPSDPASASMEAVVLNTTTGVLEHRPFPTTTGGVDCDWTPDGNRNVYTAVGTSGACPDDNDRVAIGIYPSYTQSKLHVTQLPKTGANEYAIKAETFVGSDFAGSQGTSVSAVTDRASGLAAATYHYGVWAIARNAAQTAIGVYGQAQNLTGNTTSQSNTGVYGHATGDTISRGVYGYATGTGTNYGVYGEAAGGATNNNYGVFGRVTGNGTGVRYAGYFQGATHIAGPASCTTNTWTSDATLKTDVQEIEDAMATIEQLRPTTYRFLSEEHIAAGLPDGLQRGLIAQEVEQVLPDLVSNITIAPIRDTTGAVIHAGETVKGVNYIGLIPLLIAAMQEQNDRIDHLEQALAACCANPDGSRMQHQGLDQPSELDGSFNGNEKLRIQPNPFNERTTVFYTLDRGGRTQLLANSSDGRDLRVLQEADLEAGSYQFDWNTAALAPGMYYVTLLLDGQPVVKKAVKVDR